MEGVSGLAKRVRCRFLNRNGSSGSTFALIVSNYLRYELPWSLEIESLWGVTEAKKS
jgi:hypothetical protein